MICCLSEIQTYLGVLYFDLLKSNNATIVRKRNVLDCRDLAQWNLSIVLTTFIMDPILDSLSLSPTTKGESQAASQLWENKINKLIESSFSVLLFSSIIFHSLFYLLLGLESCFSSLYSELSFLSLPDNKIPLQWSP